MIFSVWLAIQFEGWQFFIIVKENKKHSFCWSKFIKLDLFVEFNASTKLSLQHLKPNRR